MAIGNSTNAGLLAVRILAASGAKEGGRRKELLDAMLKYQQGMTDTVMNEHVPKVEGDAKAIMQQTAPTV